MLFLFFFGDEVIAQLFFKHGNTSAARWWWCFILGNTVGVASTWLLMKLYQRMDPNKALAVCMAGGFPGAQIFLALVFHSRPTLIQWTGLVAVATGMAVATLGTKKTSTGQCTGRAAPNAKPKVTRNRSTTAAASTASVFPTPIKKPQRYEHSRPIKTDPRRPVQPRENRTSGSLQARRADEF